MNHERIILTVICPVYNEEENIFYFVSKIKDVFDSLVHTHYDCRLLFTNNRSTDATLSKIMEIETEYDWVYHVTLSRNMGYQLSVLCGLTVADSDLYMVCDVDCEDPPEMLLQFLQHIEQGRDIVYGIRNNRPDSFLMAICRRAFYFSLRKAGDFTIIPYMAEFCLFRRAVRDAVITNVSTFPFIRAEIGYVGFDILGLPYRREPRRYGKTHYNYWRSAKFAWSGMLASTTLPLRAALYLFPAVTLLNLAILILFSIGWVGFDITIAYVLFINAIYMTGVLAFMSVYVARIYHNTLGRKRFIVDQRNSRLSIRM
jgi:dolichol-phosphate mannosyltransferase